MQSSRVKLLVAGLLAACVIDARPVCAQESATQPETEPATEPATGAASAANVTPEAPAAAQSEALERFDRAATLFERGDARGALAEMQAVYDLLEGRADQYVVLYNFGRIYEALHRYDRATELYRRYLAESPADGADRADAEAALRVLERLLGTLQITVNVPAEIWLGEDLVGHAPGEIVLPAGVHSLELRAEGYEVARRRVELTAGSALAIELTLARLGDVRGISPAFAFGSAAIGLVSLGVGVGLGVHALSMRDGADACVGPMRDVCDPVALAGAIEETALGADVAFGGAALFLVTATVLAFLTDWGAVEAAPRAALGPALRAGPGGVAIAF